MMNASDPLQDIKTIISILVAKLSQVELEPVSDASDRVNNETKLEKNATQQSIDNKNEGASSRAGILSEKTVSYAYFCSHPLFKLLKEIEGRGNALAIESLTRELHNAHVPASEISAVQSYCYPGVIVLLFESEAYQILLNKAPTNLPESASQEFVEIINSHSRELAKLKMKLLSLEEQKSQLEMIEKRFKRTQREALDAQSSKQMATQPWQSPIVMLIYLGGFFAIIGALYSGIWSLALIVGVVVVLVGAAVSQEARGRAARTMAAFKESREQLDETLDTLETLNSELNIYSL